MSTTTNESPFSNEPEELSDDDLFNSAASTGNPLEEIALCFSGGGFRAASFSLGALSYLNRIKYGEKPLLHAVKFITSTSGGSICNAYYTSCVYNDMAFIDFYNNLRQAMNGEELLKKVGDILVDKSKWTETGTYYDADACKTVTVKKERNLINAFAKSYDEILFNGKTLGSISGHTLAKAPHLEESALNTTEFNNGLAFYFQVNGHKKFVRYIGNGYLRFKESAVAERLKLSDIVAASSCFPGGFEPIRYPHDFIHEKNTDVNALLNNIRYDHNQPDKINDIYRKPFALMDGGIVDNMGINCVLKADKYRQTDGGKGFSLILSCDVTSYFNDPLEETEAPASSFLRFLNLKWITRLFLLSNLVLLAAIAAIIVPFYPVAGYILLLPALTGSTLYWIGFCKLRKAKKNETGTAAIALKNLSYFYRLPLRHLIPMIKRRSNSVSKLVGDLFLKQIRRNQYDLLFHTPAMKDRAIACLVYEFSTAFATKRLENLNKRDKDWWPGMQKTLMPSVTMQQMVDRARTMGTTLWFTCADQKKRDELIATGQLTACYSLIKHICRLEVLNPDHQKNTALMDLKKALLDDWELFKKDPHFLV